ncbi:peptidase domain-containing ABC transporter [Parendozoicomonas haliclonae]|uniref:Toxin RTX-I translocation ATP-binding protein n=1 Tax=Parendozoicomonas haliclonae TaxID=1960125 RepID=A0A1X7AEU5_9GAMM|nr:peptidase domain-containing ABC transporter [Parendozoicomonas haliclonae]SMA35599.1 Toxin RTX-I translocation ATP-binding protein [Parendozoicomonas haliclonae]
MGEGRSESSRGYPTAVDCLVILGRYHHLQLSPAQLNTSGSVWDSAEILRIARDCGLQASEQSVSWEQLPALGTAMPVMVPLANGNSVVLSGFRQNRSGELMALISDPLSERKELLEVGREEFCGVWQETIILVKPLLQTLEPPKAFDLRWLWQRLTEQKSVVAQVFSYSLVMHLLAFILPIFTMVVFDKVVGFEGYATLHLLFIAAIITLLLHGLLGLIRQQLILHASGRLDIVLAERAINSLLSLPLPFFQKLRSGQLIKQLQDADQVRQFVSGSLLFTLLETLAIVVLIPVLMLFSVPMTVMVLVFGGLIGLCSWIGLKLSREPVQQLNREEGERQARLVESVSGIETLKTLSLEQSQVRRWLDAAVRQMVLRRKVGSMGAVINEATQFLQRLMLLSIIWWGAQLVLAGEMTLGVLIAFNIMAGRISGPLVQLASLASRYQETATSARMLGKVLNHEPERLRTGGLSIPVKGALELDKVSFRYHAEQADYLSDISVKIRAGEKIGIVGASGAGKSTLARLLLGLLKPTSGTVRLDGYNLKEFDLNWLRSCVSGVFSDSRLFSGSVLDNLTMVAPSASREDVIACCRLTGAHTFIEQLPQGYDSQLDEGGLNLSTGQRQRLVLARALLANPQVLVMDEATSALDGESETQLWKNLPAISRGRTLIHISHRLSSMVMMDRVLVMESGKVVASGSHHQLLAGNAHYQKLWQAWTGAPVKTREVVHEP